MYDKWPLVGRAPKELGQSLSALRIVITYYAKPSPQLLVRIRYNMLHLEAPTGFVICTGSPVTRMHMCN